MKSRGQNCVEINMGVTRGGFYKQFCGWADLAQRLLDWWESDNILLHDPVLPMSSSDAHAMLQRIAISLVNEKGFDPDFDMAVRDWARHDPIAARTVLRVDAKRQNQLTLIFLAMGHEVEEAEVRARIFYYHQVGYYALGVKESRRQRERLMPIYLRILIGDKSS